MTNEELKSEADALALHCELPGLLSAYTAWFIGGSYNYDLMCWRDLDIYILDPEHDLKRCFEVGYELTQRLKAWKARFTNSVGSEPNGLYWGIKLGDVRKGAWKLDVWFLDQASYDSHVAYCSDMRQRLTDEKRSNILAIKQVYWQRPEYRDTVTSNMIYRAVLDNGVKTLNDFEQL